MNDFDARFNKYLDEFNSYLTERMEYYSSVSNASYGSDKMIEAMNYSLTNGGKRIRPVLTLEFCRVCGGDYKKALPFALALEMIHTYSLIHDDLPCMDDDNMRRGKPSNHVIYGYANALLAGDGLLTLAFEEASSSECEASAVTKAVNMLAKGAGYAGMIAGQVMDLANEGKTVTVDDLKATDERKTGALIKTAAVLGCVAAGADSEKTDASVRYCENIGIAFQIVDDILDVTSTSEVLGKPTGSDDANEKCTYVSLLGLEKAKEYSDRLTEEAVSSLNVFGDESSFLKDLAVKLADRKN